MTPARRGLEEDAKRLLTAILEFSTVMRRDETPAEEGDSGLGLGKAMREHGLGMRHASALLAVALFGPMSVTELARRHHVLVKTASLVAVELEHAGLLDRKEDASDRRRTILAVARGKERVVQEGINRRIAPLERVLAELTEPQREGLICGLERLAEEISSGAT
jgi:DNA-binding MarR family transcriptional regulator